MGEARLWMAKGMELYQVELLPDMLPEPPPRRPQLFLPICSKCSWDKLPQELIAAPGGKWACARGHGILADPTPRNRASRGRLENRP